ncbi:MAG: hypothetical protein V4596_05965 [Bdellovibrionota bacterium]
MKNLITAILIACTGFSAFAEKDRGGGDTKEQEFAEAVHLGWARLNIIGRAEDGSSTVNKLTTIADGEVEEVIKKIVIEFTDQPLYIKGVSKEAVNDPSKFLIRVNEAAWDNLSKFDRQALAIHELLGVAFGFYKEELKAFGPNNYSRLFDDSSYNISNLLKVDSSKNKYFDASVSSYILPVPSMPHVSRCQRGFALSIKEALKLCKESGYTLCRVVDSFIVGEPDLTSKPGYLTCKTSTRVEGVASTVKYEELPHEIGRHSNALRALSSPQVQILTSYTSDGSLYSLLYSLAVQKNTSAHFKSTPKRLCTSKTWTSDNYCESMQKSLDGFSIQGIIVSAQCKPRKSSDNCSKDSAKMVLEASIETIE